MGDELDDLLRADASHEGSDVVKLCSSEATTAVMFWSLLGHLRKAMKKKKKGVVLHFVNNLVLDRVVADAEGVDHCEHRLLEQGNV